MGVGSKEAIQDKIVRLTPRQPFVLSDGNQRVFSHNGGRVEGVSLTPRHTIIMFPIVVCQGFQPSNRQESSGRQS